MEFHTLSYSIEVTQYSHVTEHCAVQDGSLLIIVIPSQKKLQVCRVGPVIQVQVVFSDTCFYCDAAQLLHATVSL